MRETVIDPNEKVESPCRRTSSWAFIGYHKGGTHHPIGVFLSFEAGVEQADAWLKTDPEAAKWEGHILYETLLEDDDEV